MTNLAIKGIIAVKAMAEISRAVGQEFDAQQYDVRRPILRRLPMMLITLAEPRQRAHRLVAVALAVKLPLLGRIRCAGIMVADVQSLRRYPARNEPRVSGGEYHVLCRLGCHDLHYLSVVG